MKVQEILRDMMNLIDGVQSAPAEHQEPEYANTPHEHVAPPEAAYPAGDDMHHSKNPADIRTNAPSMYPAHQHQPKE